MMRTFTPGRFLTAILLLLSSWAYGQTGTGTLKGRVLDAQTKEPLVGAAVVVVGTYSGAQTDIDGTYSIKGVKHGDYTVRISYIGYVTREYTGIRIRKDEETTQNAVLNESGKMLDAVEVIGEKAVVDLESGRSEVRIGSGDIKEMTARSVQDVVALQAGVSQSPDGLQIRGGRVYETQYVVDGINAADPLAGTGFGVGVSSNSIADVTVVTGGSGAEYNGNSGVIVTKIKEGGEKLQVFGRWQRDNFGVNKNQGPRWNTDIIDLNVGAPIPGTNKKLRIFGSFQGSFADNYCRVQADQLYSSILTNSKLFAPRQDNAMNGSIKLSYYVSDKTKITFTSQNSVMVNQSTRSLQIIGNNAIVQPGFQYPFTLQPDNANTYTHKSSLMAMNINHKFSDRWRLSVDLGRLFTNLRTDANGRPFRTETINSILDPQSITTNPVTVYNPQDTGVVFVNPGSGFYNNGGIATTWHDHWVEELTLKYKFTYQSPNRVHQVTLGHEHRKQSMQWVDVTSPWVGAPIRLSDGTLTPSRSIGTTSDVWKVNPSQGGIFVQDELRYKGIIATLGARVEYWAPGDLAENAVKNPNAPVTDEIRSQFNKQTFGLFGQRWKASLLPRLNVSFPVTENNVMYFNYSHSMRLPHPRFVYAGLDPVYQDRSFLSNLGNPNLNPEVAVSYEFGVKSQINRDLGITFTAFYKDNFDYIVNGTVTVKDATGRFVEKTFSYNQDYARVRGAEVMVNYRFSQRIRAMGNVAFQAATGKSNSALESQLQIKNTGQVNKTKEQYLAWDRPLDAKGTLIYTPDSSDRIFNIPLKGFRLFVISTWKSGLRYTPAVKSGVDVRGRDIWQSDDTRPYSKVGSSWFWTDIRITRDFKLTKRLSLSASVDITNVFNNKNAQIINPVTGRAYEYGDPVLYTQRDPLYTGPRDSGLLPNNPARYLPPRQVIYGVSLNF